MSTYEKNSLYKSTTSRAWYNYTMDKYAEKLSRWFGSTPFIFFHLIWFTIWIVLHFTIGFDEEWQALTIIVSLEAIFLALFILRGDNVQADRFEEKVKKDLRRDKKSLQILEGIKKKQK